MSEEQPSIAQRTPAPPRWTDAEPDEVLARLPSPEKLLDLAGPASPTAV